MKTKQVRSYLGNGSWSTPVDLGADASNVDYTKGTGASAIVVSVQDELDGLNEIVVPDYIFDTRAEMEAAVEAGEVPTGATVYVKEGSGSSNDDDYVSQVVFNGSEADITLTTKNGLFKTVDFGEDNIIQKLYTNNTKEILISTKTVEFDGDIITITVQDGDNEE